MNGKRLLNTLIILSILYNVSKFIHDIHSEMYIPRVVTFSQLILPSVKELSFIQWT